MVAPAIPATPTAWGCCPGAATPRNGCWLAWPLVAPVAISAPLPVTVLPVVAPGADPKLPAFFQCVPSVLVKPNSWPREPWASTE